MTRIIWKEIREKVRSSLPLPSRPVPSRSGRGGRSWFVAGLVLNLANLFSVVDSSVSTLDDMYRGLC